MILNDEGKEEIRVNVNIEDIIEGGRIEEEEDMDGGR